MIKRRTVLCTAVLAGVPVHMAENMAALHGALPDAALRRRMAAEFK